MLYLFIFFHLFMSDYLRFNTFGRTQPDVNSPIFEKLTEGFSEVKGGYNSKVITGTYS
jgi:hypothetical protein